MSPIRKRTDTRNTPPGTNSRAALLLCRDLVGYP